MSWLRGGIVAVVVGLVLGSFGVFDAPHLTKELLFLIVLPGLLFEAAYHMEFEEFWHAKVSIFSLAVPGLLVAIGLTGAAVWLGVTWTGLAVAGAAAAAPPPDDPSRR